MLVLSRKIGERITIGEDIRIIITRIANGRVTIGIDAPKQIAVRRNELVSRPIDRQIAHSEPEVSRGDRQSLQIPA
ncbi:hypothetical protein FF011L_34760 [Roseimaritima multifibrata]|uniref:Translational regulator CsrA n=1 Tax=Roseimaritima multifibrata TaxID=1930274 RepID=A0A517MIH5_9BACT|nr:carbon storage regulator [Roseimaritima multifibrata]QDS94696.1 hypothetical protein FF011L_34760 [Roseimaritima multifibrata]